MMAATLLLIEDDDAVAEIVSLHLAQAGYRLHREADGRRALQAFDRQRWDLVLLDLTLPNGNGWDICKHIRARHDHTPIIMITARTSETHRVLGLELGADDYLAKPFSVLELIARVRALLRRVEQLSRPAHSGAPLAFWQFRLDPVKRELRRATCDGEASIELKLREFDLLHFLARHPAETFSRSSLLQRVWGAAFDGYEHTVNSHIHRLRAKIEADPKSPQIIETIWGLGYRFNNGSQLGLARA